MERKQVFQIDPTSYEYDIWHFSMFDHQYRYYDVTLKIDVVTQSLKVESRGWIHEAVLS